MITSMRYDNVVCCLVDEETGEIARVGIVTTVHDAEEYCLTGGRAPHKPSSTGKVWVEQEDDYGETHSRELYPSVVGLKWVPVVSEGEV